MFLLSSVYIAFTFLFDIWSTEHFKIITENVLFGQIRFRKVKNTEVFYIGEYSMCKKY